MTRRTVHLSSDEILTPDETAIMLRRSANTLRHWRLNRIGPRWWKAGRRVHYMRSDVEQWIEEQRAETKTQRAPLGR